ncbi:hypothetical protein DTO027B5_685 [Paecilomyces variotii]|nr:hypothetical protein DTO169C6_531 [Paecilomyces variotii]KAJ9290113.1 hypothetical protein DTO021C3_2471 [Paecilomyces variotii]KAJ9329889.1 hypothetical protein DTO027B3_376 [Paecilomyces variotii]KAJ9337336.1 hypothetical protein DTO027B5_685 [Paecilomyces variotii]
MEDLSGLSWTPGSNEATKPPPMTSSSLFSTMRSTPLSGRSTPLSGPSGPSGPSNPPSKPTTPANDSFANLVSFNASNPDKNLSLAERQKRLQEERAKQEAEKRQRWEAQYGGNNARFWDSLGQGEGSPATVGAPQPSAPPKIQPTEEDEDDILAAFKASAPVDASTNFPIPSSTSSPAPVSMTPASGFAPTAQNDNMSFLDDDDPFGLGQMSSKPAATPKSTTQETTDMDDDFLGDLAKPVSEFSSIQAHRSSSQTPVKEETRDIPKPADGVDRAVAELVDMGFPAEKARQALSSTESGMDVQAAVGWLLNQAHAESREKARARDGGASPFDQRERGRDRSQRRGHDEPAWSRGSDRSDFSGTHDDRRSPATAERDAAHIAANFGNSLFKTANSLWKTGSKKFQQAVQELNSDHDPNQPRWMRDASVAGEHRRSSPRPRADHLDGSRAQREAQPEVDRSRPEQFTDEALLLEASEGPPNRHRTRPKADAQPVRESHELPLNSKNHFSHPERRAPQPAFAQQRPQASDSRSRLSRAAVEEQSTQAYISPARRRRPATEQQASSPNVDLFDSPGPSQVPRPQKSAATPPIQASRPSKPSAPLPAKPKAPPRSIPQVSSSVLMSSHQYRQKGTEAFKRGDYAAAHEAFSAAVSGLPDKHPVTIVLLSNRAMTALKIGEPKSAIDDADTILSIIGPSKGEAESIDMGNGEPSKPMRDFYGKALMRKAEALEQLERWEDAARVWKQAVETGHGGSTSIQGRNRCEKAAGISKPTPRPASRPIQPKKPASRPSALSDLAGSSTSAAASGEAVTRLRAANAEADRADEEKLALTDSVDAKIAAWKGGKQDNLRALLGSLDNVLWPEAGWKKVNLSELVLPNKVKIQYMKGIAKVHPDKIPTSATIEQRMIAGAVFSALNEAWDKFKKENNL